MRITNIPSKPLNNLPEKNKKFSKKFFSTFNSSCVASQVTPPLNPWFVTGLVDGEGSFMVNIVKHDKLKIGWRIIPIFQISLHAKDKALLEAVQYFFKGFGHINNDREFLVYRISSRKELIILMEHFLTYPLITKKSADFELFKQILDLFNNKKHLTKEGLQQIVNLRASLNKGLSSELNEAFPETIPVPRPLVNQEIKDPNWLAGFTTGEGCFTIGISKSSLYKTGFQVSMKFILSQDSRDSQLMESLTHYLSCGRYRLHNDRKSGEFVVTKLSSIINTIIPFFKKYPIMGVKALDFSDFCKVAAIMAVGGHLEKSGLNQIQYWKDRMNTKREIKSLPGSDRVIKD